MDAELVIVGDRDRSRVPPRRWHVNSDRSGHIDFLGKQDHVERPVPQAHMLLMPSRNWRRSARRAAGSDGVIYCSGRDRLRRMPD